MLNFIAVYEKNVCRGRDIGVFLQLLQYNKSLVWCIPFRNVLAWGIVKYLKILSIITVSLLLLSRLE